LFFSSVHVLVGCQSGISELVSDVKEILFFSTKMQLNIVKTTSAHAKSSKLAKGIMSNLLQTCQNAHPKQSYRLKTFAPSIKRGTFIFHPFYTFFCMRFLQLSKGFITSSTYAAKNL
jgi:hypothetical protein